MSAIVWSAEQEAIFEFMRNGRGNLVIEALAGTGKTTTAKQGFACAPEGRMLYAVFNKRNQREAEAKITDSRVDVKTLHSLGFAFIKRVWSNAKPDDDVETDRAEAACGSGARKEVVGAVIKLAAFLKNTTIAPTRDDAARIMQEQDCGGIDAREDEMIACASLRALELSKVRDAGGRISFNDMVWLPVAMGWVRQWFDLVLIDEAQDMNLPQLRMARGACKPGGRVIVVGDQNQAIYGFRGAVTDGMKMMTTTLRAEVKGLTVTRRCPKAVVAHVNDIVPHFRAADDAPEGLVAGANEFAMMSKAAPGDAIVSRLNAPLMPIALSFLRRNVPARIEGRDIGKQLVGMVRSMRATTVPQFVKRVEDWAAKQRERIADSKNAEKKLEAVSDMAQTLIAISEGCATVRGIEQRIESLFQDTDENSKPAIVLSSTHKAKGLEWPRVFVLAETFRKARGGEEARLYYVACTRTMSDLYLVSGAGGDVAVSHNAKPSSEASLPQRRLKSVPARAIAVEATASRVVWESPLPGQAWLERGCVIAVNGVEYVSVRLGSSNAQCVALQKVKREMTVRGNDLERTTKVIESYPRKLEVSRQMDRASILRRMTETELQEFLTRGAPKRVEEKPNPGASTESETVMAKKTKKSGGDKLSAIVKLAKAGKSESEIAAAIKAEFGGPLSESVKYFVGREWRRFNKEKAAPASKKKSAAKVPARKTTPAKAASAKKASALPPRPAPAPVAAAAEPVAASAPAEPAAAS